MFFSSWGYRGVSKIYILETIKNSKRSPLYRMLIQCFLKKINVVNIDNNTELNTLNINTFFRIPQLLILIIYCCHYLFIFQENLHVISPKYNIRIKLYT